MLQCRVCIRAGAQSSGISARRVLESSLQLEATIKGLLGLKSKPAPSASHLGAFLEQAELWEKRQPHRRHRRYQLLNAQRKCRDIKGDM